MVFLIVLLAGTIYIAAADWRRALPICYCFGLLQDPVRKALPGQPAYVILLFLPVGLVMLAKFASSRPSLSRLLAPYPGLRLASYTLLAVLVTGSAVTLSLHSVEQAAVLLAVGWLGYLLFPAALVLGYFAVHTATEVRRALALAAAMSALALCGTALECLASEPYPSILGSMNPRPWWHTFESGTAQMICGFFRSPEITGWHGAMLGSIAVVLLLLPLPRRKSALWLAAVGWGMTCCLLSARRKMLAMFVLSALLLLVYFAIRRDWARCSRLVATVLVGSLASLLFLNMLHSNPAYLRLATSTLADTPERLNDTAIDELRDVLAQAGWWGYGLGTGAQGLQHVDAKAPVQFEGGILRIAVEGGGFALAGLAAVALLLLVNCARAVRLAVVDPTTEVLAMGALASIVANAACFVVGHQVYGDPFTIALVGFLVGLLLACGTLPRQAQPPAGKPAVENIPACAT